MPKEKVTQEDIDREDDELITTLIDRRISSNGVSPAVSKHRRTDSYFSSGGGRIASEHINAFKNLKSPNGSNRQQRNALNETVDSFRVAATEPDGGRFK